MKSITDHTKVLWPVFFIWPFFAFILALFDYRSKTSRNIVYCFLIFYGLTYIISSEGIDSYVYAQKLIENAGRPFNELWEMVGGIYTYETSVDMIEPLISFIVSRFTDKHYLLFGMFAAVFGFFYLKSINLLFDRYAHKPKLNALLLLILFIIINPIFNINGFRFNTAAWVFFYGVYNYIASKEKRFLIVASSSIFVHFSFLGASIVLVIYGLLGNRNLLYAIVLTLSFIFSNVAAPYLNQLMPSLGLGLQNRIMGYTNVDYVSAVAERRSELSWFMSVYDIILYYLFFVILFLKIKNTNLINSELRNLFSFLLLFLAFANFMSGVPSGDRFLIVFSIFGVLFVFLFLLQVPSRKGYFVTLIGLFPISLLAAIWLRIGSESMNLVLFLPIPYMILNEGLSIYSFIFG